MTDPTITDEELAVIRKAKAQPHDDRAWDVAVVAQRLIADLHASRDEVAALNDALRAERSEIERLQAQNAQLERLRDYRVVSTQEPGA
jgi:hypothetical protein